MKKRDILIIAAVGVLLIAYAVLRFTVFSPPKTSASPSASPSGSAAVSASPTQKEYYITRFTLEELKTALFEPRGGGESYTIIHDGGSFQMSGDTRGIYREDDMRTTMSYAADVPFDEVLGEISKGRYAEFGLDNPAMKITLNAQTEFLVGDLNLSGGAYYVLSDGALFLVDAEIAETLIVPKNGFRALSLWGDSDELPVFDSISIRPSPVRSVTIDPLLLYRISSYYDDKFPGAEFVLEDLNVPCSDAAVKDLILAGIYAMDLDEIAVEDASEMDANGLFEYGLLHTDTLSVVFGKIVKMISIGGEAPGGGRYLKISDDDAIYIDRLGYYGFLDVRPINLCYGMTFVNSMTIRDRTSKLNSASVYFNNDGDITLLDVKKVSDELAAALKNISVYAMRGRPEPALSYFQPDSDITIVFAKMENERLIGVSTDGEDPYFACNINDFSAVVAELEAMGYEVPFGGSSPAE
jgi:hypothetical protein